MRERAFFNYLEKIVIGLIFFFIFRLFINSELALPTPLSCYFTVIITSSSALAAGCSPSTYHP